MRERKASHLEKFSLTEYFLAYLRYRKISKYIWKGCDLLDVGCGYNGNLLNFFSKDIQHGTGIDISVNDKKNNNHIKLINWDLNSKAFPEIGKFDIISCLAVIEHVNDPKNLTNFMYSSLKDSGTLLLTVPTWEAKPILEFLSFKLNLVSKEEIKDHKRYFSKEEIINLCNEAGFKEIKHSFFQIGWNNFVVAKK